MKPLLREARTYGEDRGLLGGARGEGYHPGLARIGQGHPPFIIYPRRG